MTIVRTVTHATFKIERTYAASPARVFRAHADEAVKRRWFVEGEGWEVQHYALDFRVGGLETSRFNFRGGPPMTNDTIFMDIVPERRIVFSYWMTMGGNPISASLATVELEPVGDGTRLIFTEQGAYLDGHDDIAGREQGSRWLLEQLAKEVEGPA
jgi:uncharacterized protein YndB with AHSA1/START domain